MNERLIQRLEEIKELAQEEQAEETFEFVSILLEDYEAGVFQY